MQVNDTCSDRRQNAAASVASVGGSVTSGKSKTSKTAPTALHAAGAGAGAGAAAATEATSISDQKSMEAKLRLDLMRSVTLVDSGETIVQNLHLQRLLSFGAEAGAAATTAATTGGTAGRTGCCRNGA